MMAVFVYYFEYICENQSYLQVLKFEMSFGLTEEGSEIRRVVNLSLAEGIVTEDLKGEGEKGNLTTEVGDYLVQQIIG